jgi:hemerythrin-like domain-containing protein
MSQAVEIIRSEHRAMASVMQALRLIARNAVRVGRSPDFSWIRTLLVYLDRFPERLHHTKEERFLLGLLERRKPRLARAVMRLQRDHRASAGYIVRMCETLICWERGDPRAGPMFVNMATDYCHFNRNHMRLEETEVLPAALAVFSPEDWREIDAAFAANGDPVAASRGRAQRLVALQSFIPRKVA